MSDNIDRILATHLKQRPGARHAYHHDPNLRDGIERMRQILAGVESAMRREGLPYHLAERVLNEVVSSGLDGWEQDKRNRERYPLLPTFDLSELG